SDDVRQRGTARCARPVRAAHRAVDLAHGPPRGRDPADRDRNPRLLPARDRLTREPLDGTVAPVAILALAMLWPRLPYGEWTDTRETLHMQLQVIGKVRLALSPLEPQWANVALYMTGRGLWTSTIPHRSGEVFDIDVDFLDHRAAVRTGSGRVERVPMHTPVARFYAEL